VGIYQTRQLEHVDFFLAIKNDFERGVSFALLFVLELMLLDILPNFFGTFGSWQRRGPHDFCQRFIGLNRFHERAVCFAFVGHRMALKNGYQQINHKFLSVARGITRF